jgi:phosphohistidine phosphatase SixA
MIRLAIRFAALLVVAAALPAKATVAQSAVPLLKQDGYVVVFRHGATDESQKDVYPFRFEDTKAQRQLNEKGRETARTIGASLKELGIPIGEIYTSRLNRAVETGKLIGARDVTPKDELTDSGAGSASSMANPEGNNEKFGRALRELALSKATANANLLIVPHKTNVTDAFGQTYADIQEGEALVFRPTKSALEFVVRVKADDWAKISRG